MKGISLLLFVTPCFSLVLHFPYFLPFFVGVVFLFFCSRLCSGLIKFRGFVRSVTAYGIFDFNL